ncbi:FAD-dependent monooxygenase [Sphaerisporangium flaviroseum]|uniref:FAD-dependent monooxygenase n=1 Tax=Sphaerisporangium flaviroseum TaxID=509199 RepID=A0ABP7JAY6_9ACTN
MFAKSPEVIVVGGGIGGMCLAQALHRDGVPVQVYERGADAGAWLQGYRIHVNQMGSRSLSQCLPRPLWQAFVATAGDPGPGFRFQTEQLDKLVFVDESLMNGGATAPADRHYAADRLVLRKLLLTGMEEVVRFGKVFERYETRPDGRVTAFFSDGTSATGDLLVGADGANSTVRRQYLPHARRVETDAVAIGGRLPLTPETRNRLPGHLTNGLNLILPQKGCAMFTASFTGMQHASESLEGGDLAASGLDLRSLADELEDYVLFAFIAHRRAYPGHAATLDGQGLKGLLGTMIEGWHPSLRRMVADSDPESLLLMPFKTATPVPSWPASAVTLIGDSIHNMTPAMGMGANVALRDAALLSSHLTAVHRGERSLLDAVGAYEKQMADYGFQAVRTALRLTDFMISDNAVARRAAKGWFRLCDAAGVLKRLSFGGRWTDPTPQEPERLLASSASTS